MIDNIYIALMKTVTMETIIEIRKLHLETCLFST